MGPSGKHKQRLQLTRDAAAAYLRQLADGIERGAVAVDGTAGLELAGGVLVKESLKIKVRGPGDGEKARGSLKIKLQLDLGVPPDLALSQPAPGGTERRPLGSYKRLKKQMKRDFRALWAAAGGGHIPQRLVRGFHADCHRMTAYPGKGDPFYPPFNAAADQLLEAAERDDLEEVRRALQRLDRLRHDAHDEYK